MRPNLNWPPPRTIQPKSQSVQRARFSTFCYSAIVDLPHNKSAKFLGSECQVSYAQLVALDDQEFQLPRVAGYAAAVAWDLAAI